MMKSILVSSAVALLCVIAAANAQSATCGASFMVQPGDTVQSIANRCGVQMCTLYLVNQNTIGSNINLIIPGQVLTIPAPVATANRVQYDSNCRVSTSAANNDLAALNYALTLEHLEAAFYNKFQAKYTDSDFTDAGMPAGTYAYLTTIQSHENAHVSALNATVNSLGGTPVMACKYDFSAIVDVPTYLAYARVFENTGVSAYDGAINTLSDNTLQQVAATIATVEARHAAFLNQLNNVSPFPNVTDPALAPSAVVAAVTPFIVSCDGTLSLPIVRVATADYNSSAPNFNMTVATQSDIKTLNYALTLEHLEATYYNTYASNFVAGDYNDAGFRGAKAYIELIRQHENAHVALLTSVITSLGGTPVPACTYNFSSAVGDGMNVTTFLATSRTLENVGTSAYDGAVNTLSNAFLQQAAATIATVEARHASYLNGLTGMIPFPDILDPARTPAQVVAIAGGFIVNCPYSIPQPQPQPTPIVAGQTSKVSKMSAASPAYGQPTLVAALVAVVAAAAIALDR